MPTFVRQMIEGRDPIVSVPPDASVYDALRVMAKHNVGALLVMSGPDLAGIVSERDYARKVVLQGLSSRTTPVREIMTSQVVCVDAGWTAEQCMALMNERGIRHLPVLEDGRPTAVISIRDTVRAVLQEQQYVIDELTHYICG